MDLNLLYHFHAKKLIKTKKCIRFFKKVLQYYNLYDNCDQNKINSFFQTFLLNTRLHKSRSSRSELEFDLSNFV